MSGTTSGSPRARVLAAWLRDARTATDLGVRELARKLEMEHGTLSRWETGDRLPRPEDVAPVLTALGVNGSERERLVNLARSATEPNWVTVGDPRDNETLTALVEFEQTAKQITEWSPAVIPGLLQTGDYTRAIMTDAGKPTTEAKPRVSARLSRRDVLTRRDAVTFSAIIGQEAIRQVIGGPEVMASQLRHLLQQQRDLPNMTLQILPTGHGWHPGLAGPFELLQFETGRPIVHLEHHRSSLFLYENEADLHAYLDAATTLRDLALNPKESATLITNTIATLENT
jgi:transcriptional regulator with XRE-family HTH domain